MTLAWHQLRAEQLTFWRSREAAIFVFLFPPLLFVLLASVFGGARGRPPVDELPRRRPDRLRGREHGARRARDHARDPARVRDPEAAPLDAAPAPLYLATVLLSNLIVVALQSVTVIALGVLLFDADLPRRGRSVRARARARRGLRSPGSGSRPPR